MDEGYNRDGEAPRMAAPIRLERWRAERLWARAASLEAEERQAGSSALIESAVDDPAPPDAVELDAAVQAAIESGMAPAAVRRSARLELALGALDRKRPGRFEELAAKLCAIPAPPLSATGTSPLSPKDFLAAFEALSDGDQYGLGFVEERRLGEGAELRVYGIDINWGSETKKFRDTVRMYASIPRIAVTAEPDGEGGTRFEILADTRAAARSYGWSLGILGAVFGAAFGFFGRLALPAAASFPLGFAIGAGLSELINLLIARWAFPAARKEFKALARAAAARTGGAADR